MRAWLCPEHFDPHHGAAPDGTPEEIEASWIVEAKRRLEDIRSGRCATIPADEVMQKARSALERAREQRWSESATSRYTSTMSAEALRLYEAVMQLSAEDRAELVVMLAESVGDGCTREEIDAAWRAEVRRRRDEVLEGRVEPISHEDVIREGREMIERAKRARSG